MTTNWYRTGTVALTQGSNVVTGTGTAWVRAIIPGSIFLTVDGGLYEAAEVVSNTELRLASPYLGVSSAAASYAAAPTQGYLPELAARVQTLLEGLGALKLAWDTGQLGGEGGGMSNPMSEVGDLVVGGGFGLPGRLAVGANGASVLGVVAGKPAWVLRPLIIPIAVSDEATALTAGPAKVTFRMPCAMTLTAVRASLTTAQGSGSIFTVDVNEGGASILSTKLTIDNAEKTSTTAEAPVVISDVNLADDAEITVDIDQVGNGTAKGLKVYMIGWPA